MGIGPTESPAPQVATGPGDEVYVFWRDGDDIKFRKSENSGNTFLSSTYTAFTVSPYSDWSDPRFPFLPSVVVDNNPSSESDHSGRIYVAWTDESGAYPSNIFIRHSDDGGDS